VVSTISLCHLSWGMRAERWCVCVSPQRVRADRGPPGPSPLLAEALLEQAMIGPSPNPLILSYLKYAISSQVTTAGAAGCRPAAPLGRWAKRPGCGVGGGRTPRISCLRLPRARAGGGGLSAWPRQGPFCKQPLPVARLHAGWKSLPSKSLCACCKLCAFLVRRFNIV